jgi:hypothetical protein
MTLETKTLDLSKFDLVLYDIIDKNINNHPCYLKIQNLSRTDEIPSFPVFGATYMFCVRSIVPLICQFKNNPPIKILFVIVTSEFNLLFVSSYRSILVYFVFTKGSPFTFISKDAIDALTNSKPAEFGDKISIHGHDFHKKN